MNQHYKKYYQYLQLREENDRRTNGWIDRKVVPDRSVREREYGDSENTTYTLHIRRTETEQGSTRAGAIHQRTTAINPLYYDCQWNPRPHSNKDQAVWCCGQASIMTQLFSSLLPMTLAQRLRCMSAGSQLNGPLCIEWWGISGQLSGRWQR